MERRFIIILINEFGSFDSWTRPIRNDTSVLFIITFIVVYGIVYALIKHYPMYFTWSVFAIVYLYNKNKKMFWNTYSVHYTYCVSNKIDGKFIFFSSIVVIQTE